MKQLFILASLLVIASISICCKTKKNTTTSTTSSVPATTEIAAALEDEKTIQYRVIISFISKGAGIDLKLSSAITAYVSAHPKKPTSKIVSWGREGETDHCFLLKELTKTEQVDFIAGVKRIIGTSDMVLLTENSKCNHQGR